MRFLTLACLAAAAARSPGCQRSTAMAGASSSRGRRSASSAWRRDVTEQPFASRRRASWSRCPSTATTRTKPGACRRWRAPAASTSRACSRSSPDLVVAWRLEATAAAPGAARDAGTAGVLQRAAAPPHRFLTASRPWASLPAPPTRRTGRRLVTRTIEGLEGAIRVEARGQRVLPDLRAAAHDASAAASSCPTRSELCGGRNVFADSPVMAPQVNIEAVLAARPGSDHHRERPSDRTARGEERSGGAFPACARCAPATSTRCR